MKVVVVGSGFAGLSTACFLSQSGADVTVIEKNEMAGGRARTFEAEGFIFDMGPSWYWMPDVFEKFYNQFGHTTSDFYELKRLDPSYQVIWQDEIVSVPSSFEQLQQLFEHYEKGAGEKLALFMKEAETKYTISMRELVFNPCLSIMEFARKEVIQSLFKMDLLQSIQQHLRKYFTHPNLLQLAEFPILFLGALPQNTPALYSLMNYADMKLGTWYPMGGMVKIVEAMYSIAQKLGVKFQFNEPVQEVISLGKEVKEIVTNKGRYVADKVVFACDYHHGEQLLSATNRNYQPQYWDKRDMAPSCVIFYLGINRKIPGLKHHNLFFDASFKEHAEALYAQPSFPENPLMYVCCPSKTDSSVAPSDGENLFVLIPTPTGHLPEDKIMNHYFEQVVQRIKQRFSVDIQPHIVFKKGYSAKNFISDYNAFKGNAYGLANTLRQTAILKPSIRNKKLRNLFYAGQLTVPGPGVPPSLISGEIVAKQILKTTR